VDSWYWRYADENSETKIQMPEDLLFQDFEVPLQSLTDFAYPNLL